MILLLFVDDFQLFPIATLRLHGALDPASTSSNSFLDNLGAIEAVLAFVNSHIVCCLGSNHWHIEVPSCVLFVVGAGGIACAAFMIQAHLSAQAGPTPVFSRECLRDTLHKQSFLLFQVFLVSVDIDDCGGAGTCRDFGRVRT